MCYYARRCKGICSYSLVYNFCIQLSRLQSSVFMVHFSNAFRHGNDAFPKESSLSEIVLFLAIFHLPHRWYRGVKISFHVFRHQNQNFSLVSHSCCLCSADVDSCCTRVARVSLLSYSCRLCRTRVACVAVVSLVPGTCVVK